MDTPIVLVLAAFNRAHKRMNGIYHNYARRAGLSDAAFWLIYSLYENGRPCTQKDLCQAWFYAPQTINSALKALEKQGYIVLEPVAKSRRDKQILFTEAGKALVEEKVVPLVRAEERSFMRLDERERSELLAITQKHIALLEEEINRVETERKQDGMSSENGLSQG